MIKSVISVFVWAMRAGVCALVRPFMCVFMRWQQCGVHPANVRHLTKVVVDIQTSAGLLQEEDQPVDDRHFPLHHRYVQSSEINTNIDTRIITAKKVWLCAENLPY